jgi:hypothetical protein
LYNQYVADDVQIGDFVFYNFEDRLFQKGLARFIQVDGKFLESQTTAVWGVVTAILSADSNGVIVSRATICTDGLCSFIPQSSEYPQLEIPGTIYLSNTIAGLPTTILRYPYKCLGSIIGIKDSGEVQLFLRAGLHADARIHEHQSYSLGNVPAGDWNPLDPSIITNVNIELPGWLPADHEIFDDATDKPESAAFAYNPKFLESCNYPPQSLEASGLRWQRKSAASDDPVIAAVPSELYKLGNTTIWWKLDKLPYLPWDSTIQYIDGIPQAEAPHPFRQRLWYESMSHGYGLEAASVSSLRAAQGSGLSIRQFPTGGEATTGDLEIDYKLGFEENANVEFDHLGIRRIENSKISYGFNVAGLRISSKRLQMTSYDYLQDGYYCGKLTLTDSTGTIGQELPFEAVHLNGVEEAVERDTVGLAFPNTRVSSLLARISVPFDAAFPTFDMSLVFGILLPQSGSVPNNTFTVQYKRIPNPQASGKTVYNIPTPAFQLFPNMENLTCNFACQASTASYYLVESPKFSVNQGDIVMVRIERVDRSYASRIIFLRKLAKLASPNS